MNTTRQKQTIMTKKVANTLQRKKKQMNKLETSSRYTCWDTSIYYIRYITYMPIYVDRNAQNAHFNAPAYVTRSTPALRGTIRGHPPWHKCIQMLDSPQKRRTPNSRSLHSILIAQGKQTRPLKCKRTLNKTTQPAQFAPCKFSQFAKKIIIFVTSLRPNLQFWMHCRCPCGAGKFENLSLVTKSPAILAVQLLQSVELLTQEFFVRWNSSRGIAAIHFRRTSCGRNPNTGTVNTGKVATTPKMGAFAWHHGIYAKPLR